MTTLIFDWSDWDGPATGHVIVTRRTWRRAPESLHVPWQVVLPVDGRATLDVAHVAGEVVSIRWAPQGATSRTDHVLIPDGGEHLAHLLDLVDPSTLEPLPEDLPSAVDLVARAEALVARIESGEFTGAAGTDGRGVASITAEGETATVRYTDGSVSTLPLPAGPAGAPGRDGVDGAPGADGRDGQDGHTPALSWQGTALAVDGVPGPDLRGPAGKDGADGEDGMNGAPGRDGEDGAPGPAPSIQIGTVTSGSTPSATIKGTSPDLTLDLVFAKGDQGEQGIQGPPGVVSSASSYVIVGPGRPDVPSTTAGTITGSEPVGARYESVDEAGVGARTWRKVAGNKWVVTDGDTGWRVIALADPYTSGQTLKARRIGDQCYLEPNGPQLNEMWNPGVTKAHTTTDLVRLGAGFAPAIRRLTPMLGAQAETLGYVAVLPSGGAAGVRLANSASTNLTFSLQWTTAQPWPSTLPGTPA